MSTRSPSPTTRARRSTCPRCRSSRERWTVAFTVVTITGNYDLANGIDPTGTVSFTPSAPMVNGVTVVTAPVTRALNIDGILVVDLMANTDPGTVPADSRYLVEEAINGVSRS